MASPVDTPEWELTANLGWEWVGKDTFTDCTYCSGNGEIGGGFKSLDGPETCWHCAGSGGRMNPRPDNPTFPPGLIDHMRAAFKSYFDNYQSQPQQQG